jgi:hypothetical protein
MLFFFFSIKPKTPRWEKNWKGNCKRTYKNPYKPVFYVGVFKKCWATWATWASAYSTMVYKVDLTRSNLGKPGRIAFDAVSLPHCVV